MAQSGSCVRFDGDTLRRFASEILQSVGVSENSSHQAADVLCVADEWGIRSHGLARLRAYCDAIVKGLVNAKAQPRITRDRFSTILIDGDNGLGIAVAAYANEIAIQRAKELGTAWVSVFNSNHFGIAGYYAIRGLKDDLIGVAMSNTPPLVSPTGGVGRRLGTNPLAVAFPTFAKPHVLVDMATSAASLGVVENAQRRGVKLPLPLIQDSLGKLSCDPQSLFSGGSLVPLGGPREAGGHKGYCLGAMVDLLCGVCSGAAWGPFVPPFLAGGSGDLSAQRSSGQGIGHLFGAIWIGAFEEPIVVRQRIDAWIEELQATSAVEEGARVMVPGEPEALCAADSRMNGTLLDAFVCDDLALLGREYGVPFE